MDISEVKLSELRGRLAIVPQDSTLFTGTIRYNLDPLGMHEGEMVFLGILLENPNTYSFG